MQLFRALTMGVAVLFTAAATVSAQVPRASDGHPDLNGIWQAMGTANWDLEDHGPEAGPSQRRQRRLKTRRERNNP
jgi:hypothetical protein